MGGIWFHLRNEMKVSPAPQKFSATYTILHNLLMLVHWIFISSSALAWMNLPSFYYAKRYWKSHRCRIILNVLYFCTLRQLFEGRKSQLTITRRDSRHNLGCRSIISYRISRRVGKFPCTDAGKIPLVSASVLLPRFLRHYWSLKVFSFVSRQWKPTE